MSAQLLAYCSKESEVVLRGAIEQWAQEDVQFRGTQRRESRADKMHKRF